MCSTIVRAIRVPGMLAAGLLMATFATAQAPRPVSDLPFLLVEIPPIPVKSQVVLPPEAARPPFGVGQIEIYDGPRRTVRYIAPNLSPGERSSLRDLERAENEAAYSEDLLALKRQYVDSERILEPHRRFMQQQLYGFNLDRTFSSYGGGGFGYGGGYGYPYSGYNGFGGYGAGSFGSAFGGATSSVSWSLANGMGDEGVLKNEMAKQIASQATPEFAVAAARGADVAMMRAASHDRIAKGFGVTRPDIRPAAAESSHITLTLKSGEKLEGTLIGEDADWFRVDTANSTISVRKSDVSRVEQPKK